MDVDLASIGLAARYCTSNLPPILRVVQQLGVCTGKQLGVCTGKQRDNAVATRHIEWWRSASSSSAEPRWRSKGCRQVMSLHVQSTCCRQRLEGFTSGSICGTRPPCCQEQQGVRWSDDMIRLCLLLFCRSPSTYHQLSASSVRPS